VSRRRSENPDPATQLGDVLDLLAALIAVGLLTLTLAGRSGVPRLLLALAFVAYVPGRAIVSNLPPFARWSEAALSMICSVAVLGLLATVALWGHFWHPVGLFQAEAVLSLAGLALGTARRHRRPPGAAERHDQPARASTDQSRGFRRVSDG
jgi:hypothetical protein